MATALVRDTIKFMSPSKVEFEAKWKGDTRSFSNRVSKFSYPFVSGETGLFMGASSWMWDMEVIFDGAGYEKTTESFLKECRKITNDQYDKWEVIHPTKGFVVLQPLNVTEKDDPIANANGISVSITWMEPIDPILLKTGAELAELAGRKINEFNLAAITRFDNVKNESFLDRLSIRKYVEGVQEVSDASVGKLANLNNEVFQKQLEIQNGLQTMLNASVVKTMEVAALTIQNITNPLYAVRSIGRRVRALSALAQAIFTFEPIFGREVKTRYNRAVVEELALSATIEGLARVAVTSDFESKDEALLMIANLQTLQDSISTHLDEAQTATQDAGPGDQYLAQGDAYQDMLNMVAAVIQYLIATAYNLRASSTILLPKGMTVTEAVIKYYGDLSYYDLFVTSNQLSGYELIFLEAGRSLIIYG